MVIMTRYLSIFLQRSGFAISQIINFVDYFHLLIFKNQNTHIVLVLIYIYIYIYIWWAG